MRPRNRMRRFRMVDLKGEFAHDAARIRRRSHLSPDVVTAWSGARPPPVTGRWDLTVIGSDGRRLPSWLEIQWSGNRVLVGRFVGVVGSVRPISRLDFSHDTLRFSLPPQWEAGNEDFQVVGVFAGDTLAGSLTTSDGKQL